LQFSIFLFNYFQFKINEQYKPLERFSNKEIYKVKEINHIQVEKIKAIVENQNYILSELSKINDSIIGLYKEK
jgi:hypothetical protein